MISFEELARTILSTRKPIAFGSNSLFTIPLEVVIVLIVALSAVIVCALVVVIRRQKRTANSIQQVAELAETNGEREMRLKAEPENPKSAMGLEEIKGIGTRTAQKLKAADINHVSDLAASSAKVLSQKTGLSEKSLSKWI